MDTQPIARYATTLDRVSLAYHVTGDGPIDIVWLPAGAYPFDLLWDEPGFVHLARFTDIVSSTERAASMGHRAWSRLTAEHDAMIRTTLSRYRGHEVKTTVDGFLATFDATTRAVRAARDIVTAAPAIGLEVRAGGHAGEIDQTQRRCWTQRDHRQANLRPRGARSSPALGSGPGADR